MRKNFEEEKEILVNYLEKHVELKEFTMMLYSLTGYDIPNSVIRIGVGKIIDNVFNSYLDAEYKNPTVILSHYNKEETGFVIRTKTCAGLTLNLSLISDFKMNKYHNEDSGWKTCDVSFKYAETRDYYFTIIIK